MNTSRGAVPATFTLDACVDGSAIWLRNQLSVPLKITVTGNSGRIVTVSTDGTVAAMITRIRYPDPAIMMPGDLVRVPIGSTAASVSIVGAEAAGFYAEAVTLSAFLPLGLGVAAYEAIAQGIKDIADANFAYANCLAKANWVTQIGCDLTWKAAVTFYVGKMVVMGVAKGALSLVLNFVNWTSFVDKQVPSVNTIIHSEHKLLQRALPADGTGGGSPPACPGASVFLRAMNVELPGNNFSSFIIDRGPKCSGVWAAAHAELRFPAQDPGSHHFGWFVIRNSGGAFRYAGGIWPTDPPQEPARGAAVCFGTSPSDIKRFIGC